jgi:hypothetical protein
VGGLSGFFEKREEMLGKLVSFEKAAQMSGLNAKDLMGKALEGEIRAYVSLVNPRVFSVITKFATGEPIFSDHHYLFQPVQLPEVFAFGLSAGQLKQMEQDAYFSQTYFKYALREGEGGVEKIGVVSRNYLPGLREELFIASVGSAEAFEGYKKLGKSVGRREKFNIIINGIIADIEQQVHEGGVFILGSRLEDSFVGYDFPGNTSFFDFDEFVNAASLEGYIRSIKVRDREWWWPYVKIERPFGREGVDISSRSESLRVTRVFSMDLSRARLIFKRRKPILSSQKKAMHFAGIVPMKNEIERRNWDSAVNDSVERSVFEHGFCVYPFSSEGFLVDERKLVVEQPIELKVEQKDLRLLVNDVMELKELHASDSVKIEKCEVDYTKEPKFETAQRYASAWFDEKAKEPVSDQVDGQLRDIISIIVLAWMMKDKNELNSTIVGNWLRAVNGVSADMAYNLAAQLRQEKSQKNPAKRPESSDPWKGTKAELLIDGWITYRYIKNGRKPKPRITLSQWLAQKWPNSKVHPLLTKMLSVKNLEMNKNKKTF